MKKRLIINTQYVYCIGRRIGLETLFKVTWHDFLLHAAYTLCIIVLCCISKCRLQNKVSCAIHRETALRL